MNTHDTNDSNDAGRDGFGCDAFAEELSLFVFGELEGERLAALEKHLVGCAACRSERDALQRSLEILKSDGAGAQQPQLSADRQAELLAQAQAQVRAQTVVQSSRRILPLGRLAVAAGLVATAGVGWYAWQELGSVAPARHEMASMIRARGEHPLADTSPPADSVDVDGYGYTPDQSGDKPQIAGEDRRLIFGEPAAAEAAPEGDASSVNLAVDPSGGRGEGEARQLLGGRDGTPPSADPGPTTGGQSSRGRSLGSVPESKEEPTATAKPGSFAGRRAVSGTKKGQAAGHNGPQAPETKPTLSAQPPVPGTPAPSTALKSSVDLGAPVTSGGGASSAMPPNGTLASSKEGMPLLQAGPPSTTADASSSFLSRQRIGENLYAVDEAEDADVLDVYAASANGYSDEGVEVLKKLGYVHEDSATAAPRAPLDPTLLGRVLANTCSPSEVVRFQARLAAALGVDPKQPRDGLDKDRDTIVREFLGRLSRRQNEPPHDMFFRYFGDHPFLSTRIDCKSTFGMDVDTASYTLARAYLTKGMLPPKAAVRTEEFVNAFKHGLAPPTGEARDDVFAIHTEVAPSPFGDEGQLLLQVGLKARVISRAARKPVALTFVIDVSGSMAQDGRLELVKQSLHLLVDQLDERDTIGVVSFETSGHRVLDPTNAANRTRILGALDQLRPEGSTNVDQGLRLGYEMALEQLKANAENRVILCSDGVANTGVTDAKWLGARIAECKSKYVYLNCVGVGMGNHNDALMEQLADEGDGFCAYVDKIEEAKKIFVERLTGTLMTVARNAKIQVEFDPATVRRFRQIGYENRALAHRDFRNDRVDAGEVGAGQEVVALYEIEPKAIDPKADGAGLLATVRVRYEDPDAGHAPEGAAIIREQARAVSSTDVAQTLQKATPRFRLSACVAEFAEILRQSVHARDGSLGAVGRLAEPLVDELRGDADVPEFVALVQQAARLPDLIPPRNEMVRAVDELKKLHCWREELRDVKDAADESLLRQLEEQNRRFEQALRDALDRALRHS